MKKLYLFVLLVFFNMFVYGQTSEQDSMNIDSEEYSYDKDYDEEGYFEDEEEIESSGYLGEINFFIGSPVGQMRDEFKKDLVGFEFGLYRQLRESVPLYVGGSIFGARYESMSLSYFDYSLEDGIEYEFSEDFKGSMWGVDIGVKYFSKKSFWVFNPYMQFNLEYRRAYSSINDENLDLDETVNIDFEGGNSNIGFDIGVGSIISLNSPSYFLNFKVSYNSGGGLFLYQRNNKTNVNVVSEYFDKKFFPISFLMIKLGISFL